MIFPSLYEELFYQALRIRMVEERIIDIYPSDKIQSPVHLSIGQEAVAVGVCHPLNKSDLLFTSYRGHAYYLAKGGCLKQLFAELYGKITGCCKGKGGSMHLAAPEVGLVGTSAVVASTIPHAVGAALAANYLKKDQIIISAFGDGAMDEGVYHESLNFAALHMLPLIFLIENNSLAVHSHVKSRHSYDTIEHARTYGINAIRLEEGYDFCKVYEVFYDLVSEVRQKRTPQLIEIYTFRYKEHVGVGDDFDAGYRSYKELVTWQQNDPIFVNHDLIDKYRLIINKEIDEAVQYAEKSPLPDKEQLLSDVVDSRKVSMNE